MCGDGAGAGELRVAVHTAHGVGHAVGSGTGGHIVRMQRTAGAAAGGHGEVLLALLDALLLIGAGHRVLEASRVGGVAGDGHIHAFMVHDSHTLPDVIRAVAAHVGAFRFGIADLTDNVQLAGEIVKLGLHIGEAVDAAYDLRRVLAKTVQDDPQRFLTCLVCVANDADCTFGSGKGLVTGQEREALALVAQQHGAQIAVAQAHLAVLGHGAVDAEGLQSLTDLPCGVGSGLNT